MSETSDEGPIENAPSTETFAELGRTISQAFKEKESLTCSICHKPITLESNGIFADENGRAAHTACYVKRLTAK
jgi:nitrate/TMAO reductase-like tetraheme cytochrome c subunit